MLLWVRLGITYIHGMLLYLHMTLVVLATATQNTSSQNQRRSRF